MSEREQRLVRQVFCVPDPATRQALGIVEADLIDLYAKAIGAYGELDADGLADYQNVAGRLDDVMTTMMGKVRGRRAQRDSKPYLLVIPGFTADVPNAVAGHFANLVEQDVFIILVPLGGAADLRLIRLITEGAGCENISFVLTDDLGDPAKARGPRLLAWLEPRP